MFLIRFKESTPHYDIYIVIWKRCTVMLCYALQPSNSKVWSEKNLHLGGSKPPSSKLHTGHIAFHHDWPSLSQFHYPSIWVSMTFSGHFSNFSSIRLILLLQNCLTISIYFHLMFCVVPQFTLIPGNFPPTLRLIPPKQHKWFHLQMSDPTKCKLL